MKNRRVGTCHICHRQKLMTFEHIPPKCAGNTRAVESYRFEAIMKRAQGEKAKFKIQQQGAGEHRLCQECNNFTGSLYAAAYRDWVISAAKKLAAGTELPENLALPYQIYPLRVIKQIIVILLASWQLDFGKEQPWLPHFVLDPHTKGLPPNLRLFCYLLKNGRYSRSTGMAGRISEDGQNVNYFGDWSFWPFGYILSVDGKIPHPRLYEITWFSNSAFSDKRQVWLPLAKLPTTTMYPGDFRSEEEVSRDRKEILAGRKRSGGFFDLDKFRKKLP